VKTLVENENYSHQQENENINKERKNFFYVKN
jgi:hypothetical protein